MGKIIKFPRRPKSAKRLNEWLIDRLPDFEQHCAKAESQFTCASCNHVSKFSFKGLIFKNCTFYCSNCGTGYTISNPLFTKNTSRHQK